MIHKSSLTLKAAEHRQLSALIREIVGMGLQWVQTRENSRTACNAFFDPKTGRLYTTFSTGLIQRERPGSFMIHQGPVNKMLRTKKTYTHNYSGKLVEEVYVHNTPIKIDTEIGRLERLLECLKNTRGRKGGIMPNERKKLSALGFRVS